MSQSSRVRTLKFTHCQWATLLFYFRHAILTEISPSLIQKGGVDHGPCHRYVLLLAGHNIHPSVLQPYAPGCQV